MLTTGKIGTWELVQYSAAYRKKLITVSILFLWQAEIGTTLILIDQRVIEHQFRFLKHISDHNLTDKKGLPLSQWKQSSEH